MPEITLNFCPACGRLPIRPAAGACPGCGLPLDEHTRAWRSSRTWHHRYALYGLLGLAVGLGAALSYRLTHDEVPNALLPVATGLAIATLGLLMDRILAGRLSGRFVAIAPTGVVVGTRRHSRRIPWHDLGRLRQRDRVPKLERLSDGVQFPLEDIFEHPGEVENFRRALDTARRRYATSE